MDIFVLRTDESNRLLMVGKTWQKDKAGTKMKGELAERSQEGSRMKGKARFSPNKYHPAKYVQDNKNIGEDDVSREEEDSAIDTITPNSSRYNKAFSESRMKWRTRKQWRDMMTMANGNHSQVPWVMQNMGEYRVTDRDRGSSGSRGGWVPPTGKGPQRVDPFDCLEVEPCDHVENPPVREEATLDDTNDGEVSKQVTPPPPQ
ncbi:hypothetical protein U1Q18_012218 [Sarracenia purpurea var. burkii]